MQRSLRYGDGTITLDLPDEWADGMIVAAPHSAKDVARRDEEEIIRAALRRPIDSERLEDMVRPGESVCIVTSDLTRPMPSDRVLPIVLRNLLEAGISADDVTVLFAIGIHRRQTRAEQVKLVGDEVARQVRCVDSDPDDLVNMGRTELGTPVHLTRVAAESDRVICLGNVEFHYFAGYSGGLKAILPGVCGPETVAANHRMMTEPTARAGVIDGNPVRRDIDSVIDLVRVDFILNVVIDEDKQVVGAFAGHPFAAHRRAVQCVDVRNRVAVENPAHLVIASAGGHPKDLDLYQAQKALDHAASFALPGAPIVLVARCSEGYGNRIFAEWLGAAESAEAVLTRLKEDFQLGGHKAAALVQTVRRNPTWLVSDMEAPLVREAFMQPVELNPEGYLYIPDDVARAASGLSATGDITVLVLPDAPSVLPLPAIR